MRTSPTSEQSKIIQCDTDILLIQAAAGTGKTTTLALIADAAIRQGLPASRILVLSKTPTAVAAMRKALKQEGVITTGARGVRIETITQISQQILTHIEGNTVRLVDNASELVEHAWAAMDWMVLNTPQRIKDAYFVDVPTNSGISRSDDWAETYFALAQRYRGGLEFLDDAGEFVNMVSTALDDPSHGEVMPALWFRAYTNHVRRATPGESPVFRGVDDATYDLARNCVYGDVTPEHSAVPHGVALLLLDEMHDLNAAGFEVLKLLIKANQCRVVGVGDVDQTIYERDAAKAEFLSTERWEKEALGRVQELNLSLTFRYGQGLSDRINLLLPEKSRSRLDVKTRVDWEASADASQSEVQQVLPGVLDRLNAAAASGTGHALAIVLRSPSQTFAVENELIALGAAYTMNTESKSFGLSSCFDWSELLLIRGLVAVGGERVSDAADTQAVRKGIIQAIDQFAKPNYTEAAIAGAGARDRAEYVTFAQNAAAQSEQVIRAFVEGNILNTQDCDARVRKWFAQAVDVVRQKGSQVTVMDIASALNMDKLLLHAFVSSQRRRQAQVNLRTLHETALQHGTLSAFFKFLNTQQKRREALELVNAEDSMLAQKASSWRKRRVLVEIYHVDAVKGLEFSDVYVPHVNRGEFPLAEGLGSEERNRFYVAISRTKQRLTVSAQRGRESEWFLRMAKEVGKPVQ